MSTRTVTVGNFTAELVSPDPFTSDVLVGLISTLPAGYGAVGQRIALLSAALAVCWPTATPWPGCVRPRPLSAGADLYQYGKDAYSDLRRGKVPGEQILNAGRDAVQFIFAEMITAPELEAAVGKSEGGEAA